MGKLFWNRCLICTSRLNSEDEEVNCRGNNVNVEDETLDVARKTIFLKYVLGLSPKTGSREDGSLLNEVLQLMSLSMSERDSTRLQIRLCGDCDRRAEVVSRLHLELEVVQMKILNVLETVKRICRWVEDQKGFEEEMCNFERSLEWRLEDDNGREGDGQRLLKTLAEVRNTVVKNEIRARTIFNCYCPPRIILERCPSVQKKHQNLNILPTKSVVKKEELDDLNYDDVWFPDNDDDFHNDDKSSETEGTAKINEKWPESKCKRKQVGTSSLAISSKRSKVQSQELEQAVSNTTADSTSEMNNRDSKTVLPPESEINKSSQQSVPRNIKKFRKRKPRIASARPKSSTIRTSRSLLDLDPDPSPAKKILRKLKVSHPQIFSMQKTYSGFTCYTCSYKTDIGYKFDQHLRQHENDEKCFQCPETSCDRSYTNVQFFIFHLQQHSTRKRKCLCCDENLPVLQMEEHLKSHFERLFSCESCDFSFGNFIDLVEHSRRHAAVFIKCQLCTEPELASKLYSRRVDLRKHLYEYHKIEEILIKCDYPDCTTTFLDLHTKKAHVKNVHKNGRCPKSQERLKCNHCTKSFSSSTSLSIHKKVHSHEKDVLCDQCPAGFRTNALLESHKISVHGKQPYKCDFCVDIKKEFATKAGLDHHISVFHEKKRWKCSKCEKELYTKAGLITHEQTHSEQANFQCQTCGHATKTLAALKRHQKLHGEKKYVCSYCPKAFTIKRYLNEHTLTHTKEQPFVCDLCGSRFNQRYSLSFHKKKKHGFSRTSGAGDSSRPENIEESNDEVEKEVIMNE